MMEQQRVGDVMIVAYPLFWTSSERLLGLSKDLVRLPFVIRFFTGSCRHLVKMALQTGALELL